MRVSGNRRPRGGRSNPSAGRTGQAGGRSGPNNNNRRSNSGNRNFDSNGPDGKIRGSAVQVNEKYVSLARDSQTAGDHVAAENYFQHAEHYFRIMLANNLVKQERAAEQAATDDNSSNVTESDANIAEHEASVSSENQNVKSDRQHSRSEEREKPAPVTEPEPIIIDLSDPDPVEASDKTEEAPVVAEEADTSPLEAGSGAENAPDDADKPKSKRRVSRTRGLRRRTSRRSDEASETDEPQTTE